MTLSVSYDGNADTFSTGSFDQAMLKELRILVQVLVRIIILLIILEPEEGSLALDMIRLALADFSVVS